jgi:multisubunit Na+/H+ antiporter MnhB subunit
VGLVILAWRSLHAPHLFTAVVMFIAFGLLMALAWVRLDAIDIALAEAAIGAGITGALLLDAAGYVIAEPRRSVSEAEGPAGESAMRTANRRGRLLLASLVGAISAVLAVAVWTMPDARHVRDAVAGALEHHPVANAVTAVLLDFRAYDTFLEMGVLALAVLGALLLKARVLQHPRAESPSHGSLIFIVLVPALVPLMILMAGFLLWAGTAWSGGAFPAGAILGAAGVLLLLVGAGDDKIVDRDPVRFVIALGLLSFIGGGAVTMAAGRAFLDWSEDWTYGAIVAIEALLTLSIGGVLALLYGASAKVPPEEGAPRGEEEVR